MEHYEEKVPNIKIPATYTSPIANDNIMQAMFDWYYSGTRIQKSIDFIYNNYQNHCNPWQHLVSDEVEDEKKG